MSGERCVCCCCCCCVVGCADCCACCCGRVGGGGGGVVSCCGCGCCCCWAGEIWWGAWGSWGWGCWGSCCCCCCCWATTEGAVGMWPYALVHTLLPPPPPLLLPASLPLAACMSSTKLLLPPDTGVLSPFTDHNLSLLLTNTVPLSQIQVSVFTKPHTPSVTSSQDVSFSPGSSVLGVLHRTINISYLSLSLFP